jgi:hypothetical protein
MRVKSLFLPKDWEKRYSQAEPLKLGEKAVFQQFNPSEKNFAIAHRQSLANIIY